MSRIYNGLTIQGNLTADQKRTISMTIRSLKAKGIPVAVTSTVNEPTTPIKAVASGKATTSRRLTYEETQAFNRGEDIRITKAIEKEYPALKTITKRAPKRTTRKTTKVNTFKRDVLDARILSGR